MAGLKCVLVADDDTLEPFTLRFLDRLLVGVCIAPCSRSAMW